MSVNYIALIPAYEPDGRICELVKSLKKKGFDVIVVDDGSGTNYTDLFRTAEDDAAVLTHSANRGKGAAIKTGLDHIRKYRTGGGYDRTVVVTVDADGQHLAEDAMRIARTAGRRPGTLVLGSRMMEGDAPLRSRFGNGVTRHVYSLAAGRKIYDTQTGLRAFTSDLIPMMLEIPGDRYEYEMNMLLEFSVRDIPIVEEKIETVYIDNNSSSHFDTLRDSFRVYKEILKFSASSFAGFLIDYAVYALLLALTGYLAVSGRGAAAPVMAAYGLQISNIGARIVSSAVNYTINSRLVFRHRGNRVRSALQYFALAAVILAGNTAVLGLMAGTFGMNRMLAKLITEIIFFMISWTVQKYVIFFDDREDGTENVSSQGSRQTKYIVDSKVIRPARLKAVRAGKGGTDNDQKI